MNLDVKSSVVKKIGTRLAEDALDEVCSIIYSRRFSNWKSGLDYLYQINAAHLLMLEDTGIIDEESARKLAIELMSIQAEGGHAIPMDTSKEDLYFNFESYLISRVGELIGGKLHTARSRNDMMATTERMVTRDCLLQLIAAALDMIGSLLRQAERYAETVMPGYTHMQPAQPITYGFYLHALGQAFLRDMERLLAAYQRTNRCPMGAGAFAGVTFPIDREKTARLLGFSGVVENTLDATASRDFSLEVLSALHIFSLTWSRAAQDFYMWGTEEFGFFNFPDSIASTSSIMPQKKNPVVLEYLKGRAGHVMGALFSATAAIKGSGFSHAGDSNRESLTGFSDCFQECLAAVELLRLMFEHAAPRAERMRSQAEDNFCCVTDLADLLVRQTGISFRQAHHVVGRIVRLAVEEGVVAHGITPAMVSKAGKEVVGMDLAISGAQLHDALSPESCVRARRQGGPDPRTTIAAIEASREKIEGLRRKVAALSVELDEAKANREALLISLAGA